MDQQPARSAEPIDWSGIRASAVAIGVREAGRQASSHLPKVEQERFVQRVMKRSQREGWMQHSRSIAQQGKPQPLSANVRTGSQTLEKHLETIKSKSRVNLSKFVLNGSKVAARSRSPLADAGKVKDLASVMEKVWPEEKATDSGVMPGLQFFSKQTVIQVNQKQADA